MKKTTKFIIGSSLIAATTIATGTLVSKEIVKKIRKEKKKYTAKKFVEEKLNSNQQLLNIIDDLSESDLDHIFSIVKKMKSKKEHISIYGNQFKENLSDLKEKLLEKM